MKNETKKSLPNGFHFKKKFGQNFLKDVNLLRAIADDAAVTAGDNVLEIGAGAGALTAELSHHAQGGKVVSVEIDLSLREFLEQKFVDSGNVKFVFGDILEISPAHISELFDKKPFKVVANLPYYISTPILFYLIESGLPIQSITVMLQRELVDRIVATPGSKDYGALSVILGLYGEVKKCRDVPRHLFTPSPNVDSAILSIKIEPQNIDIAAVSRVVKASFAHRRKTLTNNLMEAFGLSRQQVSALLGELGFTQDVRAERLDRGQFVALTTALLPLVQK